MLKYEKKKSNLKKDKQNKPFSISTIFPPEIKNRRVLTSCFKFRKYRFWLLELRSLQRLDQHCICRMRLSRIKLLIRVRRVTTET